MLDKVKTSLRIRNNNLDNEIEDLIATAKRDLEVLNVEYKEDPLINRAIICFCKIHLSPVKEIDVYERMYEKLRNSIRHNSAYRGEENAE